MFLRADEISFEWKYPKLMFYMENVNKRNDLGFPPPQEKYVDLSNIIYLK